MYPTNHLNLKRDKHPVERYESISFFPIFVAKIIQKYKINMAKPFIKWAGGKSQLIPQFEQILPQKLKEYDRFTYIEPFVGGGAMLFYMLQKYPNIDKAIINDINPNLTTAYRVIRDTPELLITELSKLQSAFRKLNNEESQKQFYLEVRSSYNNESHNDIVKTSMFIFLNRTCFNGLYRVNSKGLFNVPFGKYTNPTICDTDLILDDSRLLQNVEILCGDYTLIEPFVTANSFIYFDPPYRPISATSSFTSYSKENFDDEQQIRLSKFFMHLSYHGCQMMLSNSDCSIHNPTDTFLNELYKDFTVDKVQASRHVNANPTKRGKLTEILVRNYKHTAANFL